MLKNELQIQENVPLASHCTLGIGGSAHFFITVKTIHELSLALQWAKEQQLKPFILGKGSNLLFDDRGYKGVVIHNKIDFTEGEGPDFHVGAGYSFSLLGIKTARAGWSGLEFAAGIPGSVGGAIYMNAGANQGETQQCLTSVTYVTLEGEVQEFKREKLSFSYRMSPFQNKSGAIAAATFHLTPSTTARDKQLSIIQVRTESQPYKDRSAGCVFRNPLKSSAGALIDAAGLKGLRVGGAEVSSVHANFLINREGASSRDFLSLVDEVKRRVKGRFGADLEMEVRVVPYE